MHRKRTLTQRSSKHAPRLDESSSDHGPTSLAPGDLAVTGRSCPLVDLTELPADVAQDMIDRGANVKLLTCHGELVDRFDARHLLDSLPAVDGGQVDDISDHVDAIYETKPRACVPADDVPVAVLERERYWALTADQFDDSHCSEGEPDDLTSDVRTDSDSSSTDESEVNVTASFPNKRSRIGPSPPPVAASSTITAPSGPPRPPSDIKVAEIIRRTASFIRTHSNPPLAEQVLLAKQGTNPQFAFLHASDPNHSYYQSLIIRRNADDELMEVIKATAKAVARQGDAMVQMLLERNRGDPRFAFLSPWHRLHTTFRAYVSKEEQEMAAAAAGSRRQQGLQEIKPEEQVGVQQTGDTAQVGKVKVQTVVKSSAWGANGLVAYSSDEDED
ncbi:hypothetical protein BCR44DRAFT_55450 [Catenaria anguillulae PL171]|uniref:SURP motif domain-containing protein n=1 Tax=Catenaria anguillulae PL171 TaxID=765915 RepID=A0A1Y2HRD6_9FUNG|nr:hypothetical protein BCR44DRAFT_55450 [Catenaria anguillulae PL171]